MKGVQNNNYFSYLYESFSGSTERSKIFFCKVCILDFPGHLLVAAVVEVEVVVVEVEEMGEVVAVEDVEGVDVAEVEEDVEGAE